MKKAPDPLNKKFVVSRARNNQWRWQAINIHNGDIEGNTAETYTKRSWAILKAIEMAHGRPVYLKNSRAGGLALISSK